MGASSALAAGTTAATSPGRPAAVTSRAQIDGLRSQLRSGTLTRTHGIAKVCADQRLRCLSQALTTSPGSKDLLITGAPVGYGATELAKAYGVPAGSGKAGSGCTPGVGPATGVAVYDIYSPAFGMPPGFLVVGGTSASSPFLAGVAANLGVPASTLGPNVVYPAPRGALNDVTLGQNAPPGACESVGFDRRLCVAGTGWDGPTGLGTPSGKNILAGG